MRSTDRNRVLVLHGSPTDDFCQLIQLLQEQIGCIARLHRHAGVYDIGRSQAQVDKPGCLTNGFAGGTEEGNHIVIGLLLDLQHALEAAAGATDGFHSIGRDSATSRPGFTHSDFHR